MENQAALELGMACGKRCLQQAGGRIPLVEVDFAVALIAGHHEVVAIRELERATKIVDAGDGAGGVAGRAKKQQLAALPHRFGHAVQIGQRAVSALAHEIRLRAREQGRAFIDLIERIRHHDDGIAIAIGERLHDGEQGFASAVRGQHHGVGIHCAGGKRESPRQPIRRCGAEFGQSRRRRVAAQCMQMACERIEHELRRCVARLADGQRDVRQPDRRLRAGKQFAQAFERVGPKT